MRYLDVNDLPIGATLDVLAPNATPIESVAIGRRAWLFAGSDRGGERAAAMFTLIETAKLNSVDPQAWLADVLRRINDHTAAKLHELLPWHWKHPEPQPAAA